MDGTLIVVFSLLVFQFHERFGKIVHELQHLDGTVLETLIILKTFNIEKMEHDLIAAHLESLFETNFTSIISEIEAVDDVLKGVSEDPCTFLD